ncbi:MAG: hypothetical protein S4CHLAM45_08050 [Chlamydiales bacterium]|nr:hypothetical protein [Chlamydiales bacterium]MCH9620443.1 hypothetical protein [Chlamydiales bacterium]MCH9622911.1 hypothetical protein [Chlamydiales bacterium]
MYSTNHAQEIGKSILLMPLLVPLSAVKTAVLVTGNGIFAALSTIKALGSFFTNGLCCESDSNAVIRDLNDSFSELTGSISSFALESFRIDVEELDKPIPFGAKIWGNLDQKMAACARSDSFFHRHVTTRLGNTALLVGALVIQVVNIAIGLIALVFAVATFGESKTLNERAHLGCQSIGGTVTVLLVSIAKIINPQLGT